MSKRRKRSPWPLALLFRLTIIIAAASLIISYCSVYINPSLTSVPLFFGLYLIPLVIINIAILITGLIRRSGAVWITFFALVPSLLFADMFVRWGEPRKGAEGLSLKICTYNVGTFSQGHNKNAAHNLSGVKEFLNQNNPDILCIQEFYVKDTSEIEGMFPGYTHYHHMLFNTKKGSKFGNITFSKYPILNRNHILFPGGTNHCIYSDIDIHGRVIRIYNTHLESHSISFTALIKKLRESRNVTEEIYEVHGKMAGTFKKRAAQVDTIVNHIKESPFPSVICGDLNDTPMSYTYYKLTSDNKDTFRQSGKGFGATYSMFWPLLRIDYILYPEPIWSLSHKTPRIGYSDHFPVLSELIIP